MSNKIISGALFDFMGWLTSRPKRIMLSSVDDASPAVDAIKDFAKMRGLSLDDARVKDWQEALTSVPDWASEAIEQPVQDIQSLSALVRAQQITIDKLEAQRLPDKLVYDGYETPQYIDGWNDCREFMKGMK